MSDPTGTDALEASTGPASHVKLVGRPNPFTHDLIECEVPEGASLAEMVEGVDPERIKILLNGVDVPHLMWKHFRPKAGCEIRVCAVVRGDDAKPIIAIVAIAAITVLSSGIAAGALGPAGAGWLGAAFAAGKVGALALAAGLSVVGTLAIRALISPGMPQKPFSNNPATPNRQNTVTGIGNRVNPFGAVPLVCGEMVFFPTLAANPYTHMFGGKQHVYILFDLGFGDLLVDQIKLGSVDLLSIDNLDFEIGPTPGLFTQTTGEASINFDFSGGAGAQSSQFTDTNTNAISIDLLFPTGFYGVDDANQTLTGHYGFDLQYRQVGAPSTLDVADPINGWVRVVNDPTMGMTDGLSQRGPGSPSLAFFQIDAGTRDPYSVGIRWTAPRAAQYEVQLTASLGPAIFDAKNTRNDSGGLTVTHTQQAQQTTSIWSILRSIKYQNPSTVEGPYGDLPERLAVQLIASNEVAGNLEQLNCRVRQQIKTWDPSLNSGVGGWTAPGPSKNPAWIYYWLLTACPVNSRVVPESRLSFNDILAWAQDCDAKGYVFGAVYDNTVTLGQVVADCCAAGRATFAVKDSKYTVVRDVAQTVPVQHFTPRNSWQFMGSRVFTDEIHALRCHFLNPAANYQQDEFIVYDTGYSGDGSGGTLVATKFETIEFRGVTSADAVWRLGKYHLAAARMRQNDYSFYCDVENLACTRGDMIRVAHDVMRWGSMWGRINLSNLCGANLWADPNDFSAGAGWNVQNGLTRGGTTFTAPDASLTASEFHLSGGINTQGFWRNVVISSDGSGYTHTLWILGTANGQTADIGFFDVTAAAWVASTGDGVLVSGPGLRRVNLTNGVWKKFTVKVASTVAAHQIRAYVYPANQDTITSGSAEVWNSVVWKGAEDRVQQIQLDETLELDQALPWTIRVRGQDGSSKVSALAGYKPGTYVWDLVTPLVGVNYGDMVQLGNPGLESQQLIVTKIEPGSDLSAKVMCQDYAPSIYTVDAGTPPVFVSPISLHAFEDPPAIPIIEALMSIPPNEDDSDPGIRGRVRTPPSTNKGSTP
jgi:predicted phage tail protein